ncbi:MAG TPA: hypothetical protein VH540_13050 [Ktedonobacterales bacterium]
MQSIDTHLRVQGGAALLGALIAFAISLPLAGIGFALIAAVLGGVFCLVVVSVLWEEHTTTRPPQQNLKSRSGALT